MPRDSNYLRFRLNPKVQIGLGARAKAPGESFQGQNIELALADDHPDEMTAYERLLGDAMAGENLLFAREDGVEAAWRVVNDVLTDHEPGSPYNPHAWRAQLTRDALVAALGLPVALANDADVAAVGEAHFGAGQGHQDVVYVTISTGVGAGILVGGRLVLPRYSCAEIGHSIIDRQLAAAGGDGTVEGLGSGTALARLAHAAGINAVGADLVRLVTTGDPAARAVWDEAIFAAALALVNLAHIVPPTALLARRWLRR